MIITSAVIQKDRNKEKQEVPQSAELKDSVDIWSDTLLYWANISTVTLQHSWECEDKDIQMHYYELYDRNDSIYNKLLDDCERTVTQDQYSQIVVKVVTNQIQL